MSVLLCPSRAVTPASIPWAALGVHVPQTPFSTRPVAHVKVGQHDKNRNDLREAQVNIKEQQVSDFQEIGISFVTHFPSRVQTRVPLLHFLSGFPYRQVSLQTSQ